MSVTDNGDIDSFEEDDDMAHTIATHEEIQVFLSRLGEDHRSAILLLAQGMTYVEIAQIEDCPVNTAKTRVFHARKLVKKYMKESESIEANDHEHQ